VKAQFKTIKINSYLSFLWLLARIECWGTPVDAAFEIKDAADGVAACRTGRPISGRPLPPEGRVDDFVSLKDFSEPVINFINVFTFTLIKNVCFGLMNNDVALKKGSMKLSPELGKVFVLLCEDLSVISPRNDENI